MSHFHGMAGGTIRHTLLSTISSNKQSRIEVLCLSPWSGLIFPLPRSLAAASCSPDSCRNEPRAVTGLHPVSKSAQHISNCLLSSPPSTGWLPAPSLSEQCISRLRDKVTRPFYYGLTK